MGSRDSDPADDVAQLRRRVHHERSSRHRGARWILAAAVFAFGLAAGGRTHPAHAAGGSPADSSLVVITVGMGAQWVDLPRFDRPAENAGWCPQSAFAMGLTVRRWCEPFAELSYAYLPGPDSVRVVSVRDTVYADLGTLTQLQGGVLIRPIATGAWQPYVRLTAGVARLSVASPGQFDTRATDALWSAGAGLEWWAHRHLVVRAESRYTGQAAASGTPSHFTLQLALGYVFRRSMLALE